MLSTFDPCFECPVKNYDGKEGCPLPLCIYDVYNAYQIGHLCVETIVLWEQGLTTEDIQRETGIKLQSNVVKKVKRWRLAKRKAGLLI